MDLEKKLRTLDILCVAVGMAAYVSVCIWYVGLALAILAVGLASWRLAKFGRSRLCIVGIGLGAFYLFVILLIGAAFLFYYHIIMAGR